jgi:hypothetical protein
MCFNCLYNSSKIFLILREIQRYTIVSTRRSARKVPLFHVTFYLNLNFLDRFSKNLQLSNFMKIRPVGAELLQADGQV